MKLIVQKLLLLFQGFYYALTGLWAIVSLDSFSRITRHSGDAYEMHSIAALTVVLGVFFVLGALKDSWRRPALLVLIGSSIAVIVPAIWHFPEIKKTLFAWDLIEEIAVAILGIYTVAIRTKA